MDHDNFSDQLEILAYLVKRKSYYHNQQGEAHDTRGVAMAEFGRRKEPNRGDHYKLQLMLKSEREWGEYV